MQITRSSLPTSKASDAWFTGDVYVDTVAAPTAPSRAAAVLVRFAPGARARPGTRTRLARRSMSRKGLAVASKRVAQW